MARSKPLKICAYCKDVLSGCGCSHRKASDGQMVHRKCLAKYEHILNQKRENEQEKREK